MNRDSSPKHDPTNPTTIRPSQLETYLEGRIDTLVDGGTVRPIIIQGGPGIGKSAIVRQVADRADLPVQVMDLVVYEPVDLRGLPIVDDGTCVWTPPDWSAQARDRDHGVVFFDDLGAAAKAVQAATFRLILEGEVGAAKLPDGWLRIAATNRRDDRTVHHPIPAPLANRFVWLGLEPDVDDWVAWALRNGLDERVVAFVRAMGDRVLTTKPRRDGPFATPRSWEFVSDYLRTADEVQPQAVLGAVGTGSGTELLEFLEVADDLPDVDAILEGRSDAFPDEPDCAHVLCSALASRLASRPGVHAERLVEYALTIPAEFSVVLVTDAIRAVDGNGQANPVTRTDAFDTWQEEYKEVVL